MGKRGRKPNWLTPNGDAKPANGVEQPIKPIDGSLDALASVSGGDTATGSVVNLASVAGGTGSDDSDSGPVDGAPRARRKYTRRKPAEGKTELDLTGLLSENLFSFHAFLAGMSGKDIFAITEDEANKLGEAGQNVARHYDIPGVSQVTVDWIRLARTVGMIYGARIFAARIERAATPGEKTNGATVPVKSSQPTAPPGQMWREVVPGQPPVLVPIM